MVVAVGSGSRWWLEREELVHEWVGGVNDGGGNGW